MAAGTMSGQSARAGWHWPAWGSLPWWSSHQLCCLLQWEFPVQGSRCTGPTLHLTSLPQCSPPRTHTLRPAGGRKTPVTYRTTQIILYIQLYLHNEKINNKRKLHHEKRYQNHYMTHFPEELDNSINITSLWEYLQQCYEVIGLFN